MKKNLSGVVVLVLACVASAVPPKDTLQRQRNSLKTVEEKLSRLEETPTAPGSTTLMSETLELLNSVDDEFKRSTSPNDGADSIALQARIAAARTRLTALQGRAKPARTCPNIESLNGGLCDELRMKRKTKNDEFNKYTYQTAIKEASCVDEEKDSEAVRNAKIQKFWSTFEDQLICDANDFNVERGNLLKFAVAKRFEEFIDDAIDWGVNLNRIDPLDHRTLLDYVEYEIQRNKGNALEEELKGYRENLRAAGAKYAKELK